MAAKSETPLQSLPAFLLREGLNSADEALRQRENAEAVTASGQVAGGDIVHHKPENILKPIKFTLT